MSFWKHLKSGCAGLAPNCQDASRTQSEALDEPLPPSKKIGLWLHLRLCKWCRRYGHQIRFLHTAAHEHQNKLTEAAPYKLSSAARERIKQKLQSEK